MVSYTDTHRCPPLGRERKRRERDGLAVTPIGRDGYYIPIDAVPANSARAAAGPDPRMASRPVEPEHLGGRRSAGWLALELRDHLLPWSREGWRMRWELQAIGVSLAVMATLAWAFAAAGRLSSGAIVAWWFGWSVYEVVIRMHGRAYVKEGPWWRNRYREARWMDMLSYVGFKNLLIGASLFLALKALGWLVL
jgi:NosR/NirI family nitrous oxide reductase transcriptional regulator